MEKAVGSKNQMKYCALARRSGSKQIPVLVRMSGVLLHTL